MLLNKYYFLLLYLPEEYPLMAQRYCLNRENPPFPNYNNHRLGIHYYNEDK